MTGTVYLVPSPLGGEQLEEVIPHAVLLRMQQLDYFIAENQKTARALLKRIGMPQPLAFIRIERFDHNTPAAAIDSLLDPVAGGKNAGVVSEAGCAALADPGALLVRRAHERGIRVAPLTGPSSIVLALIASGLESQRFAFHGYLPVKPAARDQVIRDIELRSRKNRETQIFIETPYRNAKLLDALLSVCRPDTLLCIAAELTLPGEEVRTRSISDWKQRKPALADRPTVFLLHAR